MQSIKNFIAAYKGIIAIVAAVVLLAAAVVTAVTVTNGKNKKNTASGISELETEPESVSEMTEDTVQSDDSLLSSEESLDDTSSETISESKPESSSTASKTTSSKSTFKPKNSSNTSSKTTSSKTAASAKTDDYKYNTNIDIENNVFLDALVYTGYNLKKHRADGLMWTYVLASQKRGKGWLSNITYGAGSSGYETKNGKPNIKFFESHGLVCASYVTYVYFNYLPNVAGIDTSSLPKPDRSYNADSWYKAAMKWVDKGYSKTISFTAKDSASGIVFKPKSDIPIGSIIVFSDKTKPGSTTGSHVCIYAGYKNGYHWVTHVGNSNGPEFCSVERMKFGPDPQWPLKVITTPSNIRMSALLEITLKDDAGKPISGVKFSLKNSKTGKTTSLGSTDKKGVLSVSGLSYGDYTLVQTVPSGYTCSKPSVAIKLTTKNNSYNKVSVTDKKKVVSTPEKPTESSKPAESSSPAESSGGTDSSQPQDSLPADGKE